MALSSPADFTAETVSELPSRSASGRMDEGHPMYDMNSVTRCQGVGAAFLLQAGSLSCLSEDMRRAGMVDVSQLATCISGNSRVRVVQIHRLAAFGDRTH